MILFIHPLSFASQRAVMACMTHHTPFGGMAASPPWLHCSLTFPPSLVDSLLETVSHWDTSRREVIKKGKMKKGRWGEMRGVGPVGQRVGCKHSRGWLDCKVGSPEATSRAKLALDLFLASGPLGKDIFPGTVLLTNSL